MTFLRTTIACGIAITLFAVFVGTSSAQGLSEGSAYTKSDVDLVVQELCTKRVALLGESPLHGFGKVLQFKVEVVRRLVDGCHYNALFFESGSYDFLNIRKKLESGREMSRSMIAAAIGGIWANGEVEALIPFLLEHAQNGKLVLGGLDDQIGRGSYASLGMPADLVHYLQGGAKANCLSILQRHFRWEYTGDAPYSFKDKTLILGCLDTIESGIAKAGPGDERFREYDLAMVGSLKRSFARDFKSDTREDHDSAVQTFNERDESMYKNFQWLMSRLPAHSKAIVWAATIHVAKDLGPVPGDEGMISLGSYIHREFKDQSFALGFSAYSGAYAMTRQPVRQLTIAPANSLEGQAFAVDEADTHYFDLNHLHTYGSIAARPLGADVRAAKWDEVLDGLLVFREERPPEFSRQ